MNERKWREGGKYKKEPLFNQTWPRVKVLILSKCHMWLPVGERQSHIYLTEPIIHICFRSRLWWIVDLQLFLV